MTMECPHCGWATAQIPTKTSGDWVVCRVCERPFAWRDAVRAKDKKGRREFAPQPNHGRKR